jgi:hypothetical protein
VSDNVVAKIEPSSAPAAVQSESAALISMIERAARDPNVDIGKMERLFEMQQRAEAGRAKTAFLAAFSDLQADLPAATRNGKGHNDKRYARFEDVMAALRPHLSKHGFSISHRVDTTGNIIRVTGILGHRAGHTEQTEMTLPPDTSGGKTAVHAMASAISYGKRYVTLTLTGIATEDDDDAAKAGQGAISDGQIAELQTLLKETGTDPGPFLDYYAVGEWGDLTAKQYADAKAKLVMKKRQGGKR